MKNFSVLKKLPLALAVAASLSQHAVAGQTLETVVVSATRFDMPEVITPNSITVIDRKKLDAMGSSNLADVLKTQANLQVTDNVGDGSRSTVSMRGFGSNAANNTLVLVDGRKLNNPSQESPALGAVALDDVERIEIIDGSGGILYGDQAVGGVINIITRKPTATPYTHVESSVGSNGLRSLYGTSSQLFDSGFAYRVSAKNRTADNYRDNNESDYGDALAHIEQNGDWGQVFAEAQHVHDGLRLPGALSPAQAHQNRQQTVKPHDFSANTIDLYRLGGEAKFSEQWSALAEFTDRDTDNRSFLFGTPFTQGTHVQSFSPRLKGALPGAYGTTYLTAGYDGQTTDYQNTITVADYTQDSDAWYAQAVYPFYTHWSATVGLRDTSVHDKNNSLALKHDDSETIHEYGLAWEPTEDWRLFARRAGVLRFANADDNGFTVPGVVFLKPQTGMSDELGAKWKRTQWDLSLTAFQLDLDNEIAYDAGAPGPWGPGANVNLPTSHRTGLSAQGEYRLTETLALGGGFTHQNAELASGTFKGKDVPFVARNTATLYTQWQFQPDWSLYADAIYTGARYLGSDDANSQPRDPAYWVFNTAVRWTYDRFNTALRLNNLTNLHYAGYTGFSTFTNTPYEYPSPGRTVELTVGYKF